MRTRTAAGLLHPPCLLPPVCTPPGGLAAHRRRLLFFQLLLSRHGRVVRHPASVMSFLLACRPCCLRAAHTPTLKSSMRRTKSSTAAAVRTRSQLAAAARSTGDVAESRWHPPVHPFWEAATSAMAFTLASPVISLVAVWPSSAAAAAAAHTTATCRTRALSAAAPCRVLSCGGSRGVVTVAYPAAASRSMATAAANIWAAARTPLNGGGAAWRPLCGGGRGAAATAVGTVVGERWATTGDGDGRRRGGGGSAGGGKRGTPSSPHVAHPPTVASADEQAAHSRRSATAKAGRVAARASSGLAEEGGGDQSTSLPSTPTLGRPVVVPTPDVAVRVSDETVAAVERLLGHPFASRATLLEAMTHASVDEETRAAAGLGARSNERLEWLGDGALNLVCAHFLHTRLPDHPEGELSRFHDAIVSRAACLSYVADLGLGGYLHIGQGAANTVGQGACASVGNFFEALVGALFVDGGWGAVDAFFTSRLQPLVVARLRALPQNFRSILTNYAAAHKLHLVFALAPGVVSAGDGGGGNGGDGGSNSSGSSGAKILHHLTAGAAFDSVAASDGAGFRRAVLLDGEQVGTGWGRTRKAADMAAAEAAFHELRRRGLPIEAQAVVDLELDGAPNGEG